MYDLAIVGAGPAGATLARMLQGRYRILLLDKRSLDLERPCAPDGESSAHPLGPAKCCGGLLAPDAQKMLARLGLGLPPNVLCGEQLFAVRSIDLPSRLERFYQRHYINLDREKFDRWLVSLLHEDVNFQGRTVLTNCRREDRTWLLQLADGDSGAPRQERAKILIGADGANSAVRRLAFASTQPARRWPADTYVAIQEWHECPQMLPYFGAIFDPQVTDFYSWTIPKGDFLIVGSAMRPGADIRRKFDLLKSRLGPFGYSLGQCVRREGGFLLRPMTGRQTITRDDDLALIGEAGGWISPSSAEGLSYAMGSAMLAAGALAQGIDGFAARYRQAGAGLRRNLLLKRLKCPLMYSPSLRKAVMRLGIAALPMDGDQPFEHTMPAAPAAGR